MNGFENHRVTVEGRHTGCNPMQFPGNSGQHENALNSFATADIPLSMPSSLAIPSGA
jgi:hypothetical protein